MIGALSPGPARDGPQGRQLLQALGPWATHDLLPGPLALVMDRACQGDATRAVAAAMGFRVGVPPHPRRVDAWVCDRALYKRRHEVEHLCRRLKGLRRVGTRFDKLDVRYGAFVLLALMGAALRLV